MSPSDPNVSSGVPGFATGAYKQAVQVRQWLFDFLSISEKRVCISAHAYVKALLGCIRVIYIDCRRGPCSSTGLLWAFSANIITIACNLKPLLTQGLDEVEDF